MPLIENNLFGTTNKIESAIKRLQFASELAGDEGLYLAFSGGKDSVCILQLAIEAGVKFDAHYNITGIDPPELVYFIRRFYPNVKHEMHRKSLIRLIEEKGIPPTRLIRYCCSELKEHGGEGRVCVTGVRWAESIRRKKSRESFEIIRSNAKEAILFNDNLENRRQFEICQLKGKKIVNPIIDWTTDEVWEFIHLRSLPYCFLYDEGFDRLGCIGCPMAGRKGREMEFKRYPKFEKYFLLAFDKMLKNRIAKGKENSIWVSPEAVFDWWMERLPAKPNIDDLQISFDNQ